MIDFRNIKINYAINALAVLKSILPGGHVEGNNYVVLNPTRNDKHIGSFVIDIATGKFIDFSNNDRGGDIIDLVMYVKGIKRPLEAAEWLQQAFPFLASIPTDQDRTTPARKEKRLDILYIWNKSSKQPHPYLTNKSIWLGNARVNNYRGKNQIIVPLTDKIPTTEEELIIKGIQFINEEGNKSFPLPIKGLFYVASTYSTPKDVVVISEGYATACSIAEATDLYVTSAMSAWNVLSVIKNIRKQLPNSQIIIAADNDDTGRRVAETVLREMKDVEIVYPTHGYNDFNDLYKALGKKAVNMVFAKEKFYE